MNNFNNAWVLPNGSSKYINEKSHVLAMQSFSVQEKLYEKTRFMAFTEDELDKHYDLDVNYIALKLGYIRVVSFINQFAVQYLVPPTLEQAAEIIRLALEMQVQSKTTFECFVIEKFEQQKSVFCKSMQEFRKEIMKKVEQ